MDDAGLRFARTFSNYPDPRLQKPSVFNIFLHGAIWVRFLHLWTMQDSNLQPTECKSVALPIELIVRKFYRRTCVFIVPSSIRGARDRSRTCMPCGTNTSSWRVYQFLHPRAFYFYLTINKAFSIFLRFLSKQTTFSL